MRLSKEDILKAEDLGTEEVDVPEWGGSVLVRGMTGRERDAFEVSLMQTRPDGKRVMDPRNVRAKVVARCVVDDDGKLLFSDADVAALGDKSGAAVDRVYAVAARLSGISDEDQEAMTRDFGLADGAASPSSSPPVSAE